MNSGNQAWKYWNIVFIYELKPHAPFIPKMARDEAIKNCPNLQERDHGY